jgi:hypothetical protein
MVTALNKIKFMALYLALNTRMVFAGAMVARRKYSKSVIPVLLSVVFFTGSHLVWGEEADWPWAFQGENFSVTLHSGNDNFSPSVASNGSLYLVVWYRDSGSGFDIYAARVTSAGEVLDKRAIPVCTAPNDQTFPVVSSDGETFFIAWQDRRSAKRTDIYGAWVTADGNVVDSVGNPTDGIPIAIGKATLDQVSPAVAFNGESYLVVWQGKRNQKLWNVYFTMVSKDGEIGDRVQVSPSTKDQAAPSVEADGEDYFIVWQDKRGRSWDIYGATVTKSGEIDLRPTPLSPMGGGDGRDRLKPIISRGDKFFLVIWMDSAAGEWYLEGRRTTLSPNGIISDLFDIPIQRDTTNKAFPAIIWDEDRYIVVWQDEPEGNSNIVATSVLPFDPAATGQTVSISSGDATQDASLPGITRMGDQFLILWQAKGPDGHWQIYAQRFISLSRVPPEIAADSATYED